jgi:hypothetical protein
MPQISAPFPNIAVHIEKAKGIGRKATNRDRFLAIFSLDTISIGMVAIVVR